MTPQQKHLDNLSEIRNLMERSSRFISLSGLTGVFAGTVALFGTWASIVYFKMNISSPKYYEYLNTNNGMNVDNVIFFLADAIIVLVLSIGFGILFTTRKAKKKQLPIWDASARRLLWNLFIPLATGGLFCIILFYRNEIAMLAPATLLFYGLALINASKYTLSDIRYLGFIQIIFGLLASLFIEYGLLFWALGFGVMHIIYGAVMYFKYDR